MTETADFASAFAIADSIPGWLTPEQARELFDVASAASHDTSVVEIGSHLGRSMVILGTSAPAQVKVVAIDPFPTDWRYGRDDTESAFRANLDLAGVSDRVDVRVATSQDALRDWHDAISVLYIDGAHDYWSVRHDLGWAVHVIDGGVVLIHDSFSSIGVTLGLLRGAWLSGRLAYVGRVGSLARFEVRHPRFRDRVRFIAEMPWWARNVLVKVLLRLRLRRVAASMGHRDSADPF